HNHGLWLMPNLAAGKQARRAQKPLVVSPRGMLSPAALMFSRWKKRAVWAAGQGRMLRQAACLHATSNLEYQELRALGLKNPVAVVANGVDLPPPMRRLSNAPPTVLYLGRLHPKKGLDRLLHAWARIQDGHPDWRLRIAGPAESGYGGELARLNSRLGLRRLSIEDGLYDDAKLAAYRDAALFVLPSLSENFGLTVAEALAHGLPAIATKGTPWSGLDREGCGWWIEHGVEPLAHALSRAMKMPADDLAAMGAKGRAWMAQDYSWEKAASDMASVYTWLTAKGELPAFVRLD
ncbi:MAG: glycosyltransferase, partial [Rhizomicrobium sp.]